MEQKQKSDRASSSQQGATSPRRKRRRVDSPSPRGSSEEASSASSSSLDHVAATLASFQEAADSYDTVSASDSESSESLSSSTRSDPNSAEDLSAECLMMRHPEEDKQALHFQGSDLYRQAVRNGSIAADPSGASSFKGRVRHRQNLERAVAHFSITGLVTPSFKLRIGQKVIPNALSRARAEVTASGDRVYCSQFSADGSLLMTAGQGRDIKIFCTETWQQLRTIEARSVRWTVCDAVFTPDQRFALYSSLTSVVHMANISGDFEIHEALDLSNGQLDECRVFSIQVAGTGTEIVAALQDNSVVVFDIERKRTVLKVDAHENDVNTITFADSEHRSNLILSGSDDCLIKVWDRRTMSQSSGTPVGIFEGHTDGLTRISSKGDGVYFVSNSKDQTCKLWDLRKMREPGQASSSWTRRFDWDYRFEHYPAMGKPQFHPNDCSIMTYRGHWVLETLIRAYFSPLHTTDQRYIYSGSSDGRIFIYDVLTGHVVDTLSAHHNTVRDVSWHPYRPLLCSSSFDGTVLSWEHDSQLRLNRVNDPHQLAGWKKF